MVIPRLEPRIGRWPPGHHGHAERLAPQELRARRCPVLETAHVPGEAQLALPPLPRLAEEHGPEADDQPVDGQEDAVDAVHPLEAKGNARDEGEHTEPAPVLVGPRDEEGVLLAKVVAKQVHRRRLPEPAVEPLRAQQVDPAGVSEREHILPDLLIDERVHVKTRAPHDAEARLRTPFQQAVHESLAFQRGEEAVKPRGEERAIGRLELGITPVDVKGCRAVGQTFFEPLLKANVLSHALEQGRGRADEHKVVLSARVQHGPQLEPRGNAGVEDCVPLAEDEEPGLAVVHGRLVLDGEDAQPHAHIQPARVVHRRVLIRRRGGCHSGQGQTFDFREEAGHPTSL